MYKNDKLFIEFYKANKFAFGTFIEGLNYFLLENDLDTHVEDNNTIYLSSGHKYDGVDIYIVLNPISSTIYVKHSINNNLQSEKTLNNPSELLEYLNTFPPSNYD